jgi:hypothetical protein
LGIESFCWADFRFAWPDATVILRSMLEILMAGTLLVLMVMLVVLASLARTVMRMEGKMGQQQVKSTAPSTPEESMALRKMEHGADFVTFLVEDPERRKLPKREQFASYREWRKAKGLSWPAAIEKGP